MAQLVEADTASWSAVDDTMVALVEELATQGRRIGLLSNIPEELASYYQARHTWLQHFQLLAFSCRIGHAKPGPEAYRWCQQALQDEPDHILFVDDRQENVQAAEAVGMRGHLFSTSARLREHLAQGASASD
ncbi:HAD-IA family hydrolase [Streptomyces tubercidicus]|uniref:HAD-IA family hydrolase n=1 Tax=Streptomyces tubercidicus TaxID=47759 RepID=UPI0037AEA2D6